MDEGPTGCGRWIMGRKPGLRCVHENMPTTPTPHDFRKPYASIGMLLFRLNDFLAHVQSDGKAVVGSGMGQDV